MRVDSRRPRPFAPSALLTTLYIFAAACGGGGGDSPSAPPPPSSPIAGAWDVSVALASTTCGPVQVQPQPTTIEHTAGASRFTLRHGANAFTATLAADSTFTAEPVTVRPADGSAHTALLTGRFSGSNLEADVRVDVRQRPASAADCLYTVRWNGRRTG
jgi:hypothetical protein